MRGISKPAFGFLSAMIGGCLTFALVSATSLADEDNPAPQFNVQTAPINRQTGGATSYAPIIKQAAKSVVNIYSTRTVHMHVSPLFNDPFFQQFFGGGQGGQGGQNGRTLTRREESLGSGVVVSPNGYILTANHVVQGAQQVKVAFAGDHNKEYTAKVIGTDPATDVAVLKIDENDLPAITIADSDKLEVGDVVLAMGNPFGVGQTVTMGIVSALGRTSLGITEFEDFIQTDAAINPGNSGGALVDAEGRLVGINDAIMTRSGGYQGVGFAIPINQARSVMETLIKYGKVTRGYLGISLQPEITPDLQQEFNLPDQKGAMVGGVLPDTPAAKAGLQSGDVIRAVNGKPVTDAQQLRLMIAQLAPGTKVELTVLRSEPGKKPNEERVEMALGTLPAELAQGQQPSAQGQQNESGQDALAGVEVADLDSSVREQFNIPQDVRGAVVTNVDPNSTAAEAGLQQGDVILDINRHAIRNADDAVEWSHKVTTKRVLLRIWRNGGSFYLTVESSVGQKQQ